MEYNPIKISAKHLSEIHAEILGLNKTLANKYVRVESQHKDRFYVTAISGSLELKPYQPTPTSAGRTNDLKFADREIVLAKYDVFDDNINPDTLRASRFNSDMKPGALNNRSSEFENAALTFLGPQISLGMEAKFWVEVMAELKASTEVIKNTGAVSQATIVDVLTGVYADIDDAVIESGNALIYAHPSVRKMVLAANREAQFRDVITVAGGKHYFNEIEIVYVKLPEVALIAGNKLDFIWATDLEADYQTLEMDKVSRFSDMLGVRGVMALASAVLIHKQKVLHTVA